jgi:hypothetical protein
MFLQFFRAAPLLVFPLVVPINLDMLFGMFGGLFYAFGLYQHLGFDLPW